MDKWVILESMGHGRVAGRYFVENGLHRIDIPDTSQEAAPGDFCRSEWYGNAAIFRITPVSEEAARLIAAGCQIPDAIPWDVRRELHKLFGPQETMEALTEGDEEIEDEEDY